jgi:DNA-binding GntR family transcriptional regulator
MSQAARFPLKPATRQTLADSIVESLRDAIFAGLLGPGRRLAEAQLAGSLKVSRAPVREALACLEQEGLVSRLAGGGATVTRLSRQDVEEICSLRGALEGLAVRLALANGVAADWAELAANIRATEATNDPQELARKDLEFHEKIVRTAGHCRLLTGWSNLRSQIRLIMVQRNLGDAHSHRGTVKGHRELLGALRAGDEAGAVAVLEHHLRKQYRWILNSFAEAGGAGPDGPDVKPLAAGPP